MDVWRFWNRLEAMLTASAGGAGAAVAKSRSATENICRGESQEAVAAFRRRAVSETWRRPSILSMEPVWNGFRLGRKRNRSVPTGAVIAAFIREKMANGGRRSRFREEDTALVPLSLQKRPDRPENP